MSTAICHILPKRSLRRPIWPLLEVHLWQHSLCCTNPRTAEQTRGTLKQGTVCGDRSRRVQDIGHSVQCCLQIPNREGFRCSISIEKEAQPAGIAKSEEQDAPSFMEYQDEDNSCTPPADHQSKDWSRRSGTDKTMARILKYQELGLHASQTDPEEQVLTQEF